MQHSNRVPRRRARRAVGGALLTAALIGGAFAATTAWAGEPGGVSDQRATLVQGNVQTCADIGFPTASQLDSGGQPQASGTQTSTPDGLITVTISDRVGGGQRLDIVNLGATILGTAVKAGNAYNQYPGNVLTDLIGPFVGQNNNVPTISHWILCYGPGDPGGGGGAAGAVQAPARFTG